MNWRKKLKVAQKIPQVLKDFHNCEYCKHKRDQMKTCYISRGSESQMLGTNALHKYLLFFKNLKCEHCQQLYRDMSEHAIAGHPDLKDLDFHYLLGPEDYRD